MPEGLHRSQTLADGSRVIQKYIGPSKTYAESGWDAPANWQDVLALEKGAVALDFVRPAPDVACEATKSGDGIVITIAGVTFVVPLGQVEAFVPALEVEIDRALRRAKSAQDAQERAQAAEAADPDAEARAAKEATLAAEG